MSTQTYRLPDFLSVLSKNLGNITINPHLKETEVSFKAWIQNTLTGNSAKIAEESDALVFTAMLWPHPSYEWLLAVTIWNALGFVVDDLLDHCSKEEAPALARSWADSLYDDAKPMQNPLMAVVQKDTMPSIRTALGFHWPQFVTANEGDIQLYFNARRAVIGAFIASTLTRSSRCLDIPDDVLAHPVVQGMEHTLMDVMIITNDVYSYPKEYKVDKGFTNILTVIRNNEETSHLDLQGALDHSGKLVEARVERFHAYVRDLPSFNPEIDAYLASYAEGLLEATIGNVNWHRVSRRYSVFENEEDKENNIVKWAL